MPISSPPLAIRLHRYGFLVSADLVAAGEALDRILPGGVANNPSPDQASRERELFRQFTFHLHRTVPEPHTNLVFLRGSAPVSPASFAAALWGLPFKARAILVLVCVEGFSPAEAAFVVDMPLSQTERFMAHGLVVLGAGRG